MKHSAFLSTVFFLLSAAVMSFMILLLIGEQSGAIFLGFVSLFLFVLGSIVGVVGLTRKPRKQEN